MIPFVVFSFVREVFRFLGDDGEHADVLRNEFGVGCSLHPVLLLLTLLSTLHHHHPDHDESRDRHGDEDDGDYGMDEDEDPPVHGRLQSVGVEEEV